MKFLVLAAILISFGALTIGQSHNYFWGSRRGYDVLLNRTSAFRSPSMLRVKSMDLQYPLRGQRGGNITAINIEDQYSNGKGGYAKLLAGGIGYNFTKIHLKSQRGGGFNFIVEIYGR
ncbi:probable salivary secreted peptide [Topomyia yanbarensis]|uniref:probable salivary secreted peptide n=1 Tax=Topomyia yanbarensis TaxID=2498891 RepID=UPI00273BED6A|nr:probable salivary secreted peptide [Topomyia yanbarensis]XP_058811398.1 probable salivary secreted peptide [Topomyia yanbarensis]